MTLHTFLTHLCLDGGMVLLLYVAGCAASLSGQDDTRAGEPVAVTDPGREAVRAATVAEWTVPVTPLLGDDEPTGKHRRPPVPRTTPYPAFPEGDR